MNSGYGYSGSHLIKNFRCLRTATLWAGGLGVLQSITWMALTITGIVSYNCIINVPSSLSYGSLVETVFLNIYFRGNCKKPNFNYTMMHSVDTVLDTEDILIWDCVYLGVAVCWLIASTVILLYVRKDNIKATAGVLHFWVVVTLCVCLMDLALGIIFGIDYGNFQNQAYNYNLDRALGNVDPNAAQLVAGMVAAISMMIISFKGFVFWIINFCLMVYLFAQALRIVKDKDGNDTLFMPRKDSDDVLATRPPIKAFEEEKTTVTVYQNEAFVPDNRSHDKIELNQEPIARAARMSTDASLQDRRFRNLDAFQQYPPPRYNSSNNTNSNNINKSRIGSAKEEDAITATVTIGTSGYPAPDYTPPMVRANQNPSHNGGFSRNQRY